jgi:TrmH family RNA methyltransferase
MISRAQIKFIQSLKIKKFRKNSGCFIVEGEKAVSELLESGYKINHIFATRDWLELNNNLTKDILPEAIKEEEMERISSFSSPQPVLAVAEIPAWEPDLLQLEKSLTLLLDDIRDPGNLGTIIRIADWYGIDQIFCSETCVDLYNPKVISATVGSFTRVKVFYQELEELIKQKNNVPVYGCVLDGESVYTSKLPPVAMILIGNEAQGISPSLLQAVSSKISIPSFGAAESLNAAVATAIVCDNFRRYAALNAGN